jgi:hypothetical protein
MSTQHSAAVWTAISTLPRNRYPWGDRNRAQPMSKAPTWRAAFAMSQPALLCGGAARGTHSTDDVRDLLGCGKGRGRLWRSCAASHVAGVDYSPALCSIASTTSTSCAGGPSVHIQRPTMDAADYAFAPHDTVVPVQSVRRGEPRRRARAPRRSLENIRAQCDRVPQSGLARGDRHTDAFTHVRDYSAGGGVFAVYRSP